MAETTTRPARSRAATSTARKAAPAKAAAAKEAVEPTKTDVTRFTVQLEDAGETKQYAKFTCPENYAGVVIGTLYVPKGTRRVAVLVVGDNDQEDAS